MERSHNAFIYVEILQIFGRSGTFELVVVCFDAAIEQFPLPIGFSAKERFKVFHGSNEVSGPSGVFFHDAAQSTVHVFHFFQFADTFAIGRVGNHDAIFPG